MKFIDKFGYDILPVYIDELDSKGNPLGIHYRSSLNFIKAMKMFGNTDYGRQFIAAFLPVGKSQYGVKGSGKYSEYIFRIREYALDNPQEMFIRMGNNVGGFSIEEQDGKLNIIMSIDVANQSRDQMLETITHELTLHGYLLDDIIKAYQEGGMKNALKVNNRPNSAYLDHRDVIIKNKTRGGNLYHQTAKQLILKNSELKNLFDNRMKLYEKMYNSNGD